MWAQITTSTKMKNKNNIKMTRRNKKKNRKSSKRGGRAGLADFKTGGSADKGRIRCGANMIHSFRTPPSRPYPGARFSTRQITETFGTSTGLSGANSIQQNGPTGVYGALAFQLSDLANSSTFSSLFDQYRFEKIRLYIRARTNAASLFNTASPNAAVPRVFIVIDRDDSTAPTAITDLMQYDSVATFTGHEDCVIDLVPNVTPAVFSGGAFSGYSSLPSNSTWIDIANTAVPLYGVKFGVTGLSASTTSSWYWDITAEYVVSFKNTR